MGMAGMMGSMRSLMQDASVVKQKVKPGTAKRIMRFADSLRPPAGAVPPRRDSGLQHQNRESADLSPDHQQRVSEERRHADYPLAVLAGALGLIDGALGLAQTYLSSKIGAGIVLSLRTKLFEHIQHMPLAFFTRTQTGSLVSRLNTDVGGARTAFTDILSNVVGNLSPFS